MTRLMHRERPLPRRVSSRSATSPTRKGVIQAGNEIAITKGRDVLLAEPKALLVSALQLLPVETGTVAPDSDLVIALQAAIVATKPGAL